MAQRAVTLARMEASTGAVVAVVAASALTALSAQASVPFTPVPQTLQTLAVLGCACLLGARRGAAAQLLYLAEGAAGLPVFANGSSGSGVLTGPTGGYLVGFVVAAWVAGALCERGGRGFYVTVPAMLVASAALYACGLAWLHHEGRALGYPAWTWRATVHAGLEPFVIADLLKIAVAAALVDPAAPWGRLTRRLTRL